MIQTNGESKLSFNWSTAIRNWALVSLLTYEQSIKIGAFFSRNNLKIKNSLKITIKHYYSEMYLLHEEVLSLSFRYAQRQPFIPFIYQDIEERRWHISNKKDNVKNSSQSKKDTFSTVHIQPDLID